MYEIKDLARNALRNYLVPTLQRSNAGHTGILIMPAISVLEPCLAKTDLLRETTVDIGSVASTSLLTSPWLKALRHKLRLSIDLRRLIRSFVSHSFF